MIKNQVNGWKGWIPDQSNPVPLHFCEFGLNIQSTLKLSHGNWWKLGELVRIHRTSDLDLQAKAFREKFGLGNYGHLHRKTEIGNWKSWKLKYEKLTVDGCTGHNPTGKTVPMDCPVFLPSELKFKLTLRLWDRSRVTSLASTESILNS